MTFPTLTGTAALTLTASNASGGLAMNMPASISAGEVLLALISHDQNESVTVSGSGAGWATLTSTATAPMCIVLAKVAEGSDTLTLTYASNNDTACWVTRITGHGVTTASTDVKVGTAASGTSATPNPPSLNAGSSKDWLWFAVAALADDQAETSPYGPSGYTELLAVNVIDGGVSTCAIQIADDQVATQTEDPGTFTAVTSVGWVTQTVAVPPVAETPTQRTRQPNVVNYAATRSTKDW